MVLLIFSYPVHAAINADVYEKAMSNSESRGQMMSYVWGVGSGFEMANVDIEVHRTGKPLYCPPPEMVLTTENYLNILDARLKEVSTVKKETLGAEGYISLIEYELLQGLKKTFPCKGN